MTSPDPARTRDDGMQHSYSTCPTCRCIVSDENIIWLNGQRMCRNCLKREMAKAEGRPND